MVGVEMAGHLATIGKLSQGWSNLTANGHRVNATGMKGTSAGRFHRARHFAYDRDLQGGVRPGGVDAATREAL